MERDGDSDIVGACEIDGAFDTLGDMDGCVELEGALVGLVESEGAVVGITVGMETTLDVNVGCCVIGDHVGAHLYLS